MKRALTWTLMLAPLLAASSSIAPPSLDTSIARVRAEAIQAEAEAARLSTEIGRAHV